MKWKVHNINDRFIVYKAHQSTDNITTASINIIVWNANHSLLNVANYSGIVNDYINDSLY